MPADAATLVVANVLLAVLVLVPVILVAGAGMLQAVRGCRGRAVTWVDLPGVGRIPVLRQ